MKLPIAYEGVVTSDNRLILQGSLWWKNLPLNILLGHSLAGRIVSLDRDTDSTIWAEVELDIDIPDDTVLSLDGSDAKLTYKYSEENEWCPLVVFTSMRIAGGTLIPVEKWAWNLPTRN